MVEHVKSGKQMGGWQRAWQTPESQILTQKVERKIQSDAESSEGPERLSTRCSRKWGKGALGAKARRVYWKLWDPQIPFSTVCCWATPMNASKLGRRWNQARLWAPQQMLHQPGGSIDLCVWSWHLQPSWSCFGSQNSTAQTLSSRQEIGGAFSGAPEQG